MSPHWLVDFLAWDSLDSEPLVGFFYPQVISTPSQLEPFPPPNKPSGGRGGTPAWPHSGRRGRQTHVAGERIVSNTLQMWPSGEREACEAAGSPPPARTWTRTRSLWPTFHMWKRVNGGFHPETFFKFCSMVRNTFLSHKCTQKKAAKKFPIRRVNSQIAVNEINKKNR